MPVFTKYNKTTGMIVGTLYVPIASDVQYNLQDDEAVISGEFDPQSYFVQDGVVQPLPSDAVEHIKVTRYWKLLRRMRNKMLTASDWTQVPDAPVDRLAWAEYRQALRDLPANTTDPRSPQWPAVPA